MTDILTQRCGQPTSDPLGILGVSALAHTVHMPYGDDGILFQTRQDIMRPGDNCTAPAAIEV